MLERLVVRAELSAFERSLRERLERIAALDDERLARPRSIERSPDGTLIVLSEFVPGSRLSDLLDGTAQQGAVPGVDVALGFLLDVFPALVGLHAGGGFAHGAITPGRTVLTPAGQVVLLDGIFGDALSRLHYSRRRLWREFGIAMPPAAGPPRFDAAADIAQTVLSAVMLVIGRPIAEDEYPDSITSLLVEVVDVAQIRGSSEFAAALQRFLQRCLPVPGRRPYTAADDALIDARELARTLGVDVCRRAFLEYIEQQHTGDPAGAPREADEAGSEYAYAYVEDTYTSGTNGDGEGDDDEESGVEIDLELDEPAAAEEDTVYDLNAGSAEESAVEDTPAEEPAPFRSESFDEALREPDRPSTDSYDATPFAEEPAATSEFAETLPTVDEPASTLAEETASFGELPDEPAASFDAPAEDLAAAADATIDETPAAADAAAEPAYEEPAYEEPAIESGSAPELEDDAKSSRRRKRSRSARSRKDKLRSAARPQPLAPKPLPPAPPPAPPPPPAPIAVAPPSKGGGWQVEPSRPSQFEPRQSPEPPPFTSAPAAMAPPPAPFASTPPALTPAPPPFATAPPVIVAPPPAPPPIALAPPQRPIALAPPPAPAPPIALQQPAVAPPPASAPKLKLKSETQAATAPRKPRPDPVEDLYAARPAPTDEGTFEFPWKIASGALVLLVVGLVGWRALTSGDSDEPKRPAVETAAAAPPAATAPALAPRTGRIQVETQPPGARVLLDGKPAGESPTILEVPAGRHTLTLASGSGSVRRTVRVEAGKTIVVDVPIFSGWVDVNAPIILDVAEDGKSIGSTEQNRLLLRPGRHVLTFSNRDLDYTSTHTVDVEPGEVKTLNLDPRGSANLNASPWAEVWIDGKKAGETPLANLQVPLGTHEIVFKHPQFGERRMTTTIRANAPVALSVDMSKPQ